MATQDNELFKTIRKIEIETTHLTDNLLAGAYRSAFKGRGIEFEEVREFQPGDEVRSIDWNVTAKMGYPYVKIFREERELTVMLIVDSSSSTRFGSANISKKNIIAEIGALIAFSAIKNGDKVGLLTFSDKTELFLAPKKGTRHALRIIRELLVPPPLSHGTDIAKALTYLGKVQHRPAICFIISDFMSPDFSHELTLLATKHDIVAVCVTDPYEATFPNVNLAELTDMETGKRQVIDTGSPSRQRSYVQASEKHLEEIKTLMAKSKGGFIDIRTDKPYAHEIEKFFKTRGRR